MKSIFSSRRSIFPIQFSNKEITDTQLNELFEAANWAPTHRRTEPWRFKVFRGDKKTELSHFLVDAYTNTTPKFPNAKANRLLRKSTCHQ